MDIRRNAGLLLVFTILVGFALFLSACAGSKQTTDTADDVDIDELLGEETTVQANPEEDEAEVLKLLGITPEQEQDTGVQMVSAEDVELDHLEDEVDQLRQQLMDKDREISQLRSELTRKEVKINDLESQLTPAPAVRAAPRFTGDYETQYKAGLQAFRSKEYREAIGIFSELLRTDSNHSLADNCQYWIGESYYGLADYNQAIAEFEKVFSFPNANKNDDAQLKLGLSYFKLGDNSQAKSEFQRLVSLYPKSEYRSVAEKYIARL
jgi:tol-pal system protein YbgF